MGNGDAVAEGSLMVDLLHRAAEVDVFLAGPAEADGGVRCPLQLLPELGAFHTELDRAVGDGGHSVSSRSEFFRPSKAFRGSPDRP